ncbi:MAG: NAD-dependent epimerase/dehydratase family protein, partial [Spartobacteria bacterium]
MKILLTGICGFAGSVITRTLLEHRSGLQILGLDNLSRKGSETNLEPLRALGCDIRIGDVRDRTLLESLPPCDWIIDCAANPSVLAGVDGSSSRDLVDQNLYGTVNLLELCKTWKAGFTLLSTSRVYSIAALAGLPMEKTPTRFELPSAASGHGWSRGGITEQFSTAPPISLYGSTKLCSEWLALEYGDAYGFPVWINRCGVLAGAGQFGKADQGIFSFWIHSWRAGRPLKYIGFGGSGLQVRDCLHPRDIVTLI